MKGGGWHGFVVRKKSDKYPNGVVVSGNFDTQGGASAYLDLCKKQYPNEEFFVGENVKTTRAKK